MSTHQDATGQHATPQRDSTQHSHAGVERLSTETKASTKTTELYAYVAAVVAVVVTAIVIGVNGDAAGGDSFGGSEAMRYITWLTIGYMIARGLAKAGSRDYYDGGNDRADRN